MCPRAGRPRRAIPAVKQEPPLLCHRDRVPQAHGLRDAAASAPGRRPAPQRARPHPPEPGPAFRGAPRPARKKIPYAIRFLWAFR
ncbi:hypothetical protein Saso_76980 [Streptomyces asoensis]|uniref:Uncharacterized protein n=1 Tax=Streptomyces asoensis TaxID=249586 RepID=A0ABQ3SD36_9ACTN|nr:hypothetical protein GCM10010496_78120 [Streptomyces asoensis]GHI66048.1 hypothetical protein Saso_76980 [Streptomyces asoensis]